MTKFDMYSKPMRELIDYCIANAAEMCQEMNSETGEMENITLKQFRVQVAEQAIDMMSIELDQENGVAVIPANLQETIRERVSIIEFHVVY